MLVNTQYLEDKRKASGKTKTYLAQRCNLSRSGFYKKYQGITHFTESEATILCEELNITSLSERKRVFLP